MRATNLLDQAINYDRQAAMDEDMDHYVQNCDHVVIGCGGIGWWLAVMLAMGGAKRLTLIDGDRIEPSNLPRLPVPMRAAGQLKVRALKAQLRLLRPAVQVTCLPSHVTLDTLGLLAHLPRTSGYVMRVWDCTDQAHVQRAVWEWCSERAGSSVRYCKLGYEGYEVGAYSTMNVWIPDGYQAGYRTSRANAMSSAMAAALGVLYGGLGGTADMKVDLKQLVTNGGAV
jgi:hypothetical protein